MRPSHCLPALESLLGIIPTYVSSFADCGAVKEYNRARMKLTNCLHPISILVLAACSQVHAQAPQPNGGGVRRGTLPRTWQVSEPRCGHNPQFQVQEYNQDLHVFRESGCVNYEKPFLSLLFGKEKALLLDTGAGKSDIARVVNSQINEWLRRSNRESTT